MNERIFGKAYGRIWYVTSRNAERWESMFKTIYDRDEMAMYLNELDMKGYFVNSWKFTCEADSCYLVRVELDVRFGNFLVSNIPELLPELLGDETPL